MPTTLYHDTDLAAFAIGARTDDEGNDLDDVTAEEARLLPSLLSPGVVQGDGWRVRQRQAGPNMSVDVGSGNAKTDLAVIPGQVAGQGNYLVRLEPGTVNVTVPASDPSQDRVDQVFVLVTDAPYEGGTLSVSRIGYRQGDPGGGVPGLDPAWQAALLIGEVLIPANTSAVADNLITDRRPFSTTEMGAGGMAPTGAITDFAGNVAPPGWLLCEGQAVSRATYARLFSVIGTLYGPGNGSTTFNVPDARGRYVMGKAASGTGNTLGQTFGSINHTHSGPSHTHSGPSHSHPNPNTGSAGSHGHSYTGNATAGGNHNHGGETGGSDIGPLGTRGLEGGSIGHDHSIPNSGTHTHGLTLNILSAGSHSHTQGSTGSGGTGQTGSSGTAQTGTNNPPTLTLNKIIRT